MENKIQVIQTNKGRIGLIRTDGTNKAYWIDPSEENTKGPIEFGIVTHEFDLDELDQVKYIEKQPVLQEAKVYGSGTLTAIIPLMDGMGVNLLRFDENNFDEVVKNELQDWFPKEIIVMDDYGHQISILPHKGFITKTEDFGDQNPGYADLYNFYNRHSYTREYFVYIQADTMSFDWYKVTSVSPALACAEAEIVFRKLYEDFHFENLVVTAYDPDFGADKELAVTVYNTQVDTVPLDQKLAFFRLHNRYEKCDEVVYRSMVDECKTYEFQRKPYYSDKSDAENESEERKEDSKPSTTNENDQKVDAREEDQDLRVIVSGGIFTDSITEYTPGLDNNFFSKTVRPLVTAGRYQYIRIYIRYLLAASIIPATHSACFIGWKNKKLPTMSFNTLVNTLIWVRHFVSDVARVDDSIKELTPSYYVGVVVFEDIDSIPFLKLLENTTTHNAVNLVTAKCEFKKFVQDNYDGKAGNYEAHVLEACPYISPEVEILYKLADDVYTLETHVIPIDKNGHYHAMKLRASFTSLQKKMHNAITYLSIIYTFYTDSYMNTAEIVIEWTGAWNLYVPSESRKRIEQSHRKDSTKIFQKILDELNCGVKPLEYSDFKLRIIVYTDTGKYNYIPSLDTGFFNQIFKPKYGPLKWSKIEILLEGKNFFKMISETEEMTEGCTICNLKGRDGNNLVKTLLWINEFIISVMNIDSRWEKNKKVPPFVGYLESATGADKVIPLTEITSHSTGYTELDSVIESKYNYMIPLVGRGVSKVIAGISPVVYISCKRSDGTFRVLYENIPIDSTGYYFAKHLALITKDDSCTVHVTAIDVIFTIQNSKHETIGNVILHRDEERQWSIVKNDVDITLDDASFDVMWLNVFDRIVGYMSAMELGKHR